MGLRAANDCLRFASLQSSAARTPPLLPLSKVLRRHRLLKGNQPDCSVRGSPDAAPLLFRGTPELQLVQQQLHAHAAATLPTHAAPVDVLFRLLGAAEPVVHVPQLCAHREPLPSDGAAAVRVLRPCL